MDTRGGEQMKNLLKEIGRIILAGGVSYLLTEGVISILLDLIGVKLDPSAKLLLIGTLTAVLKAVDRQLHESGVLEKGLARF